MPVNKLIVYIKLPKRSKKPGIWSLSCGKLKITNLEAIQIKGKFLGIRIS